jgi:hypothetical protein
MPRKKKLEQNADVPTPPTNETPKDRAAPAPKRRRREEQPELSPNIVPGPPPVLEPAQAEVTASETGIVKRARQRSQRLKDVQTPATAPATEAAPEVATEERTRSRTPRRRGKSGSASASEPSAVIEAPPILCDDFADLGGDMPVPSWRPRQAGQENSRKRAQVPQPSTEPGSRRERGRRRGDRAPAAPAIPVVAAQEEAAAPEEARGRERKSRRTPEREAPTVAAAPFVEPLPERPVRPSIAIPEAAPQVVLRDGVPTLVRDHVVYPPMAFFGSSADEARANTVVDEMRLAGEAGVHIHSHLLEFEVDPRNVEGSVAFAAYMLSKSIQADPLAQVIFRVVFIAPAGWQESYPEAKYVTADGALADPSVCDDYFWETAKECLKTFIKTMRLLEDSSHILGLHLERGEWFYAQGWGYDTSLAARKKFRDWTRVRYRNDIVALRAAWFDGTVNFSSLTVPEYQSIEGGHEKFIRSNRRERRWVDYHLFLSDATVERIGDLAYAAKEASEGFFLVGASYGYTFEWSHPGSGHLSLGKLLRTPEIDFIAGPPSYRSRQPGGAAPFPGPIDSFALNGKLYISEEDFKTAIGGRQEPDDFNPVIKTPQALESIHWRGAGSALAHASGVCWMDLWGNGWLKTPGIWDRAALVRDCLIKRMAAPLQDPDVAVFIDERALAYLVDEEAFALLVQDVRESVMRSGLSAAFYLLSDLQHREKFPESKLYIFLNAWDIRPELRAAIKNRLQRDNKVLFWIYAAGLFDSGRESLERAREVTGIALKPQPYHSKAGTTILNRRHPLCEAFPERGIVGGARMEPSYFAIPEDATVLGEYTQTGLPSFVVKEFNQERDVKQHWKSVFLGEPIVTPALLRALAHMAGVHVWNYQGDVVHVRMPFLTVHTTGGGPRTLTMPNKWSAYNLGTNQWVASDSSSIRFQATDGSTHLFLTGPKEDLDQILAADPDQLLRLEELPQRSEDTVRFDAATFDVPIMKLDEWMEGSDQDDISDEFLLRPKFTEEVGEEEQERGRRKRRRGRGRDREGSEETAQVRVDGERVSIAQDDVDMNIVFRRRK